MNDNYDYTHSPNPHRLYKNRRDGVVAGVCAGLADYFGVDTALLRIGFVVLLLLPITTGFLVISYIVAAIVMPQRPVRAQRPTTDEESEFWRGVSRRPGATFSNLKYRFRDLDERLQDIERVVTSDEWKLRRDFREIE